MMAALTIPDALLACLTTTCRAWPRSREWARRQPIRNPCPRTYISIWQFHHSKMAKKTCNFDERQQTILLRLYEMVRSLDQKVEYVIEGQRDLYYSFRPEREEE